MSKMGEATYAGQMEYFWIYKALGFQVNLSIQAEILLRFHAYKFRDLGNYEHFRFCHNSFLYVWVIPIIKLS